MYQANSLIAPGYVCRRLRQLFGVRENDNARGRGASPRSAARATGTDRTSADPCPEPASAVATIAAAARSSVDVELLVEAVVARKHLQTIAVLRRASDVGDVDAEPVDGAALQAP